MLSKYVPSEDEYKKVDDMFTYHPPFGDQAERYGELRRLGRALAHEMVALAPTSRELSLALTNLQNAIMWANAAIALHEKELGEE